ncbi:MAG: tetratricopeptide repeat protein [Flavobacteriales bacterium]
MNSNLRYLVLLLCFPVFFWAQESVKYSGENAAFFNAEDLFTKAQFAAAKQEFRVFINECAAQKRNEHDPYLIKAYYYEGMSALKLYNNDAIPLLEAFNKTYPENNYRNEIAIGVGTYHFQAEDYLNAQVAFAKINLVGLTGAQKEEVLFKLGYSAYQNEDQDAAYLAFKDVKDGTTQYAKPALYFYAHISYVRSALQEALEGFQALQKDSTFCGVVPYYIAQILYKQQKYQEVIDFAPTVLNCGFVNNEFDIQHIIGNAYYQLNKYDLALPFLERYHQNARGTRDDYYELGFAYYKTKQYDKAIKNFDRVTRSKDSLCQIAMYQIGDAYLQLNKLLPARSAFERAAEMTFVPQIKEDALFQFAVLSFKVDINPYDESVRAFENYLSQYPDSKRKRDVYQYLVNVYTNTSNYAKALESIENLPSKDAQLKKVYQTVAFNYGVELYQKGQMSEAYTAFKRVDTYPMDPQMVALSRYWMADISFRKNDLSTAINTYRDFINSPASNSLPEKVDAYYNIGYAYLEQGKRDEAIQSFRTYLQLNPSKANKVVDATFRIADSYYVNKQNLQAIQYYQQAYDLNSPLNDKALFYLAKAQGFNSQLPEKAQTLNKLLKEEKASKYRMNALYELARTYMSLLNYDGALTTYEAFLKEFPKSPMLLDVKLDIADIYYKKWDYTKSEAAYLEILSSYEQQREVCKKVVLNLIEVYNQQKKPDMAAEVIDKYPCANISTEEKENIFFSPALAAYEDTNFREAVDKFEIYLAKFPSGRYVNETYFYLGNSLLRTKDSTAAIQQFEKYLATSLTTYAEYASAKTAAYFYIKKNYAKALQYYQRMEGFATKPTSTFDAKLGIMRCAFMQEDYELAKQNAAFVLENAALTPQLKVEAEYATGLANYQLKQYEAAKPSLEWLVKNTTTSMGSEAKYLLASIYFGQQMFDEAENEVKALLKMKPSYNFWVAKGLLLQARVHITREDLFQAEQTLKSVMDFYPEQNDGVMAEASDLWDELMQLKNPPVNEEPQQEMKIEINNEE